MFKHNLKKVFILFMLFALVNMFAGCNDNKDITSSESFDEPIAYTSSSDQDIYDFTACDGSQFQISNTNVQFYSPGFDPNDRIYQVFNKGGVQNQIQYFEEQGYEFRPEHSLVFDGEVVPDGTTDTFEVEVVEPKSQGFRIPGYPAEAVIIGITFTVFLIRFRFFRGWLS